jgi:outer membrane receptor protein involved in Fe transport
MSGGMKFKTRLAGGAAFAALMLGGAASAAEPVKFDIAPQPLTAALNEFGVQSNHAVLFTTDLTSAKVTHGVSKEADPEIALAEMLDGTGLSFRRSGDAFLIVSASDPQSGSAAGGGADQGTVQALVVTAQKREENIQDVPIAMSAFTQEDLTRSQVAGGPDLMTQVPNFTFTKTKFSGYSIQIRGIGTQAISATTDAAVAVAFNNTPFIRNRFFEQEFYDLQRVEVLRGPQGTLYGRNATAGVVNLLSAKPTFHYEAKLSADLGNYNSQRFEGMLNIPLVEDKVALRFAGAWTKRDGYDTNQITGNRIDGRDLWSTRLSLRFEPTDNIHANLIWEHFQENDDRLRSGKQLCHKDVPTEVGGLPVPTDPFATSNGLLPQQFFGQGCNAASLYSPDSFQTPNGFTLPYYRPLLQLGVPVYWDTPGANTFSPFDPYASTVQSRDLRVIESTVDPKYKAETNIVELQFGLDLPHNLTLTSETGWLSDTLFSSEDYNRFNTQAQAFNVSQNASRRPGVLDSNGFFCDPQIGCADRLVAVDLSTADSSQFSQEFRIGSNSEGPFNFSLGANFLRYDTEDKYYVFINTISMLAAINQFGGSLPPYIAGVSDNHECLPHGMRPPALNEVLPVGECTYIDPNPLGSLNDLGHNYFLSKNPYKLISYAVFGEAYYNITPALKLTAGLRWTVDKKEAPRIPSWIAGANTVGYPVAEVIHQKWSEPTGRLTLDWKPQLGFTDDTLLYASFAHGYKAGGANPPTNGLVMYSPGGFDKLNWASIAAAQAATHPKTFDPEFVNAFELGTKNTLDDGRVTLNGDAFYYDYTGYQISQIVDRAAVNLNFDAKVWGLEFEGDWRPLENLRFGLKLGYEKTRMADGSKAVDFMDRTAGRTDWFVTKPFPTLPDNCILPTYIVAHPDGILYFAGNAGGGGLGPCEMAYVLGVDPLTNNPYEPTPPDSHHVDGGQWYVGYPGFDPLAGTPGDPYTGQNTFQGHDYGPVPNGGTGFFKDLSGHELPNAPHYTATLTADYTLPLPSDWLMTLHTDLYYQSEAWTRVFNTPGYDKLKAYTNVNLAAIFSNEDAGWKVMAYVKNVFDRDSITGAFLNSDDTGLTTNVFLTEPRLYGLRVTKEWTGGPWWTGANPNHPAGEPYPLTVELSGQVQRQDAPYQTFSPPFAGAFPAGLNPRVVQNRDLDWGDGREVKLVYRPTGSSWSVNLAARYGRTNSDTATLHQEIPAADTKRCGFTLAFLANRFCDPTYVVPGYPPGFGYNPNWMTAGHNWSDASARNREEHTIAEFGVGKDVGLGMLGEGKSVLGASLRYANFQSDSGAFMRGIPDWALFDGWFKYTIPHHEYAASFSADRKFKGAGPTLSWAGAKPVLGNNDTGHVDVDWSATGGVLFGKQKTSIAGYEQSTYLNTKYQARPQDAVLNPPVPVDIHREKSVSVPVVDLSLGLSYEIQRLKVSTGYRWERYFNVLDAGFDQRKQYDRTMDGPYFKIAVGFGG